MRREQRPAPRQGVVLPETPRERRDRLALAQDVRDIDLRGRQIPLRLRNFQPAADTYLASLGGPLPYMLRLREIDARTAAHEAALATRWRALARAERDGAAFARRWRAEVAAADFGEVNELIDARTAAHEAALATSWRALARAERDGAAFARRWLAEVAAADFGEVNELIDRHNRWYPAEARLPMDPRRGDFALVNGKDFRRRRLDAAWALERFPAELSAAAP